jgi:predicted nucleic acid-binding protein
LGQEKAFLSFVKDAFIDGAVAVVSVKPQDMEELVEVITEFGLDFDDAYQYLVARLANAVIVSFDSDFDKTETGKKTPGEVQEPD